MDGLLDGWIYKSLNPTFFWFSRNKTSVIALATGLMQRVHVVIRETVHELRFLQVISGRESK